MIKPRYKQIAKIRKWRDVKLKCHAFVVTNQWLALRKKYRFPESCYKDEVIIDV